VKVAGGSAKAATPRGVSNDHKDVLRWGSAKGRLSQGRRQSVERGQEPVRVAELDWCYFAWVG
jgi:hypothetical protein